MKRLLLILVVALIACASTCLVVYQMKMRTSSEKWIGMQLGLEGDLLNEFTEAHNRYAASCEEICIRIRKSDERLSSLILSSRTMTPEIIAAIDESDALRNECRQNMLNHFYKMAALLEYPKDQEYLRLVLPLIISPELMSHSHNHQ